MMPLQIDNRYRFVRPLGKGGMGEVACVFDRLTATEVALKRVRLDFDGAHGSDATPGLRAQHSTQLMPSVSLGPLGPTVLLGQSDTLPSPQVLVFDYASGHAADHAAKKTLQLSLAQEFHTLATLRHPHIISVLDYGFDSELRPYFTMELIRDARPFLQAARELPLVHKIELIEQLLRALDYLHRRGVLHRDLKPSNILVARDGAKDVVKVLDFGLALGSRDRRWLRAEVAGTLGYIAPEVLLGAAPSEAADLYAVGVIAFEVLAGQPPFEPTDDERLLQRLLDPGCSPDFAPLVRFGAVSAVVQQLMARVPESRFAAASDALSALCAAAGVPLTADSAVLRESYLQAAPLTGRDHEWHTLQAYVDQLMNGIGSALLIAGESGVGKSRLVEELRTYALVQGARVVQGQAVSGGGGAYHLFQNATRLLCLSAPLSDAQGAILKALAADLPRLLERSLPEAPPIEAQAAQSRLHNTFEALLAAFPAPLVLILEDLQWADTESLLLLRRTLTVAQRQPLLVVGTFRDDERPHLPNELRGTSVIKINRLPQTEIADLCLAMLGVKPGPGLLEFMVRETEGNVFFVVEIMRALAEEAGGLGQVVDHALPPQVLTGGIRTILQRRIARVSPRSRATLRLMAVAGRQLDLQVLQQFEPLAAAWLAACADAAVIEVSAQRWRFSHDKLREALLAELDVAERRRLHQQVAAAIITAYPESDAHATALAYHYHAAGMDAQAAHFGIIAGAQALGHGALAEAVGLLEQIIPFLDEQAAAAPLPWARAHRLLAQALFGLHAAHECARVCEKALARLDPAHWAQTTQLGQTVSLLDLLAAHALHQTVPASVRHETDSTKRLLQRELLLMLLAAGEIYAYIGKPLQLLRTILHGNELARALDAVPQQAFVTAVAAYLLEFTPLRPLSRPYLQQAQRLVGRTTDPLAEAQVCRIGGITHLNHGRLARGTAMLARAAELFRALGDDFMLLFSLLQGAVGYMMMGHTARAEAGFADNERTALRGRHQHSYVAQQAWAGLFAARRGQHVAVRKSMLAAYEQREIHSDPLTTLAVATTVIEACQRCGDFATAQRFAAALLPLLPAVPTGFNYFVSLAAVLEAYLTAAERGTFVMDAHDTAAWQKSQLLLSAYDAAILLVQPQARLFASRLAMLHAQPERARHLAQQGLALALKLRLPYEEALAHEQLGRVLHTAYAAAASPSRRATAVAHLRHAARLLVDLGDHLRAANIAQLLH